jgi:ABC-type transporter Mla subunit MlaD
LSEYDQKIDTLREDISAKAGNWSDESKQAANSALDKLKEQRDALGSQLENLEKAGADAWADMKDKIAGSMKDLESAYDSAKEKTSEMTSAATE